MSRSGGPADRQKEGRAQRWLVAVRQKVPGPGMERSRKKKRCRKVQATPLLCQMSPLVVPPPPGGMPYDTVLPLLCTSLVSDFWGGEGGEGLISYRSSSHLTGKRSWFISEPDMRNHSLRTKIHVSPK